MARAGPQRTLISQLPESIDNILLVPGRPMRTSRRRMGSLARLPRRCFPIRHVLPKKEEDCDARSPSEELEIGLARGAIP